MKRIEAIIQREQLEAAADALKKAGVGGFTVADTKGRGSGERPTIRGGRGTSSYVAEYNTASSIITIVDDSQVDAVMSAIADAVHTGKPGDGIISVTNVEDVLNIASKKKGAEAL